MESKYLADYLMHCDVASKLAIKGCLCRKLKALGLKLDEKAEPLPTDETVDPVTGSVGNLMQYIDSVCCADAFKDPPAPRQKTKDAMRHHEQNLKQMEVSRQAARVHVANLMSMAVSLGVTQEMVDRGAVEEPKGVDPITAETREALKNQGTPESQQMVETPVLGGDKPGTTKSQQTVKKPVKK
jgi:hypothetical protein